MDFIINHYPNFQFNFFAFLIDPIKIDINQSVKDKLKYGEQLTNATALKIFKQIKWKTEVILFILKPYVSIPCALGLMGISLILPRDKTHFIVLRMIFGGIGAATLGLVLENNYNCAFPRIADVYRYQKNALVGYINRIENSKDEFNFVL